MSEDNNESEKYFGIVGNKRSVNIDHFMALYQASKLMLGDYKTSTDMFGRPLKVKAVLTKKQAKTKRKNRAKRKLSKKNRNK